VLPVGVGSFCLHGETGRGLEVAGPVPRESEGSRFGVEMLLQ